MRRRVGWLILGVIIGFCFCALAPLLAADRVITQKPVALAHVDRLTIDSHSGVLTLGVHYHVVTSTGATLGATRALVIPLTAGQVTTLTNFMNSVVRPAINAQEGT